METIANPFENIDLRLKKIETLLYQINQNIENKEQPQPEPESNFIDIDTFCRLHPKKLSKNTVYSQISKHQIPKELIFKQVKKLLFYKDLVLQWFNEGFPSYVEQYVDDYVNNRK